MAAGAWVAILATGVRDSGNDRRSGEKEVYRSFLLTMSANGPGLVVARTA